MGRLGISFASGRLLQFPTDGRPWQALVLRAGLDFHAAAFFATSSDIRRIAGCLFWVFICSCNS